MSYKYLEHNTDVFIEVMALTLEQAFITSAYATIETMLNRHVVESKTQKTLCVGGIDLQELLYNWLEELIILTITDCFAIHRVSIKIIQQKTTYTLHAIIFGDELDIQKHCFKLEIKSPTFHLMEINGSYNVKIKIRFILDI